MTKNQDLSALFGNYFLKVTNTLVLTFEDNKISYVNDAVIKLLKREEKDLLTSNASSLVPETERFQFTEKINKLNERTDYFQIAFIDNGENQIELKARLIPLTVNGKRVVMMEAYDETSLQTLKSKNAMLEEKISHLSPLDLETHLPSLILFNDRIEQAILRTIREAKGDLNNIQTYLTVIVGTIGGLDKIEKEFGTEGKMHAMEILISRFKSSIRSVDTIAKVANGPFYFLFENIRDKENVKVITDRLQNCVKVPILYKDKLMNLTMTLGVSIYPDNGMTAVSLTKWARLNPLDPNGEKD